MHAHQALHFNERRWDLLDKLHHLRLTQLNPFSRASLQLTLGSGSIGECPRPGA
jgi:hypothetical protein